MTVRDKILAMMEWDQKQYGLKNRYICINAGPGQIAYEVVEVLDNGVIIPPDSIMGFEGRIFEHIGAQLAAKLIEQETGIARPVGPRLFKPN